jgi:hypothetical protein
MIPSLSKKTSKKKRFYDFVSCDGYRRKEGLPENRITGGDLPSPGQADGTGASTQKRFRTTRQKKEKFCASR